MKKKFPIAEETKNAPLNLIDPTACALSGGEDYELVVYPEAG